MTVDKRTKAGLMSLLLSDRDQKRESLGQILKYARIGSFLTQQELAHKLGICRQQIQKYEYDLHRPSPERLQLILNICSNVFVDINKLFREYYI